jgi:hypothetical protein
MCGIPAIFHFLVVSLEKAKLTVPEHTCNGKKTPTIHAQQDDDDDDDNLE